VLTVLITTHDGAGTLPRVLDAYCGLQEPSGGWKLLVVDNASTDATREIVLSFSDRLPLTYGFEARRGQNAARNSALPSVAGDLVVFSDDDTIPRPDWLVRMRSCADEHPDFGIFGGRVLPRWEREPEEGVLRWVPQTVGFALTDPQWEEGPIQPSWIFSPNMAIRSSVFLEGCRFDEEFGPREGSYPMGSETELTRRLSQAGLRSWHVKESVVEHIIRPFQMDRDWLLSRAIRYGRGEYRLSRDQEPASPAIFGVPVHAWRGLAAHAAHFALAKCRRDPEAIFQWGWTLRFSLGTVLEARLLRHRRGTGSDR